MLPSRGVVPLTKFLWSCAIVTRGRRATTIVPLGPINVWPVAVGMIIIITTSRFVTIVGEPPCK